MENNTTLKQKPIKERFEHTFSELLFVLSAVSINSYIALTKGNTYGMIVAYAIMLMMLVFMLYLQHRKKEAFRFITLAFLIPAQSCLILPIGIHYTGYLYWLIPLIICIIGDVIYAYRAYCK